MKNIKLTALLLILISLTTNVALSQDCPTNIGFELGNFSNWKTQSGTVAVVGGKNQVTLTNSAPIANRHTILSSKTAIDPYGKFPVLAPNGSGYSVKLGNDGVSAQAEAISYLLTVPADKPSFVITYQYAVVFQDPQHSDVEQPKFTAKVLDLSTNTYISCASFDYIATSTLPGFKSATNSVFYKGWTPVTINLSGYQGKQLLIEFTTADCTRSGHFGYAYVDVDENCANAIQGNTSCFGSIETSLKGPSGYEFYKWYNGDRSIYYGEGETIAIKPQLKVGDKIVLDLTPYNGFGCPNTVSTVVVPGQFELDLAGTINACKTELIDLTSSQYILNKSNFVKYTVYTDVNLQNAVADPTKINTSGIYYIKAASPIGCTAMKPIEVIFHEITGVNVVPNIAVCSDSFVDLTSPLVQIAVPPGLTVSYFSDAAATIPLTNISNITTSGDYYIKYQTQYCVQIKKVSVVVNPVPVLKTVNPTAVCSPQTIDLTLPAITAGSDNNLTLSYFTDAQLTTPVIDPTKISQTGNYYIKAVNAAGCTSSAMVFAEIYALPVLVVKNPLPICKPNSVDITDANYYQGTTADVVFSFTDRNGNKVNNPKAITQSGIFTVTITNRNGCSVSDKITVILFEQPVLVINQPKQVFVTQTVDLTKSSILNGSGGYEKVAYYLDDQQQVVLDHPEAVGKSGTYYISLTNSNGCVITGAVMVQTVPWPKITVPTAFTPLKNTNNTLYPFFIGIQKLNSFKVYNKWGNLVYETNSMSEPKGWDGTFKGGLQPFETYSWFAEGLDLLGNLYTTKGKTVLVP